MKSCSTNRLDKRSSGGNGGYFRGEEWFRRIVDQRTRTALKAQGKEFAESHQNAPVGELLDYIRVQAAAIGHTPSIREVVGGGFIANRLGSWKRAVACAGLAAPGRDPGVTNRRLYREEYQRQARLFKAEREENKERRKAVRHQRSEQEREAQMLRADRDRRWLEEQEDRSDRALLVHLINAAQEQGETPCERDVLGGVCIRERFGSWSVALYLAGLPIPRGNHPPKLVTLNHYLVSRGMEKLTAQEFENGISHPM